MGDVPEVKVAVTHGNGIVETYLMDIDGLILTTTTDFTGDQTLVLRGDLSGRQIDGPQ